MKKIFTLLTAALVTLTSFADHNDGRITITDFSNKQLWIEVDGQPYRDRDHEIVIDNLRPGYHEVRMYSQDRRSDWGGIFDRKGRKQVLYNSTVLVRNSYYLGLPNLSSNTITSLEFSMLTNCFSWLAKAVVFVY